MQAGVPRSISRLRGLATRAPTLSTFPGISRQSSTRSAGLSISRQEGEAEGGDATATDERCYFEVPLVEIQVVHGEGSPQSVEMLKRCRCLSCKSGLALAHPEQGAFCGLGRGLAEGSTCRPSLGDVSYPRLRVSYMSYLSPRTRLSTDREALIPRLGLDLRLRRYGIATER